MTNELALRTQNGIFNPDVFIQCEKIANIMAKGSLVPQCLQGKPADCFMVTQQAHRWGMDPFAVAQCVSVVKGKLCFEGKLVAAVLKASLGISLRYQYDGVGDNRTCKIIGTRPMEVDPLELTIMVKNVKTGNDNWANNTDQMLSYRGARDWARRYEPAAMLGIYVEDEMIDVTPRKEFKVIESGRSLKDVMAEAQSVSNDNDDDDTDIDVGTKEPDAQDTDVPNIEPDESYLRMPPSNQKDVNTLGSDFDETKSKEELDNIFQSKKDFIESLTDDQKKFLRGVYNKKLEEFKNAK